MHPEHQSQMLCRDALAVFNDGIDQRARHADMAIGLTDGLDTFATTVAVNTFEQNAWRTAKPSIMKNLFSQYCDEQDFWQPSQEGNRVSWRVRAIYRPSLSA
jgi:hypothetical protein